MLGNGCRTLIDPMMFVGERSARDAKDDIMNPSHYQQIVTPRTGQRSRTNSFIGVLGICDELHPFKYTGKLQGRCRVRSLPV